MGAPKLKPKTAPRYLCKACGAERGCACNAGVVEIIEKLKTGHERHRQRQRRYKAKKRKNANKNKVQDDVTLAIVDPTQEPCPDCETHQEFWHNSVANMAGQVISMRPFWTRTYPDWAKFRVETHLAKLVRQAATELSELATTLETRSKK